MIGLVRRPAVQELIDPMGRAYSVLALPNSAISDHLLHPLDDLLQGVVQCR